MARRSTSLLRTAPHGNTEGHSVGLDWSVMAVVRVFVASHAQHLLVLDSDGGSSCGTGVATVVTVVSQSDIVK